MFSLLHHHLARDLLEWTQAVCAPIVHSRIQTQKSIVNLMIPRPAACTQQSSKARNKRTLWIVWSSLLMLLKTLWYSLQVYCWLKHASFSTAHHGLTILCIDLAVQVYKYVYFTFPSQMEVFRRANLYLRYRCCKAMAWRFWPQEIAVTGQADEHTHTAEGHLHMPAMQVLCSSGEWHLWWLCLHET